MDLCMIARRVVFGCMVLSVLAGCSMGPRALKGDRLQYNVSVQRSNNEELLLNLVRANYLEPLFFLQVGSISSSLEYQVAVGGEATFFDKEKAPTGPFWTAKATAGFAERPTITYTPVQGEQALKQFLAEISLDRFCMLVRAGWSIESLMWVAARQIGGLNNFMPERPMGWADSYYRFLQFAHLLGGMQQRGDLEVVTLGKDGKAILQLAFADPQEADKLEALLGVRPKEIAVTKEKSVAIIILTPVRDLAAGVRKGEGPAEVPIILKSSYETLYYLSWAVDVPAEDRDRAAFRSRTPLPDKLTEVRGPHSGLIKVRTADVEPAPASAFVSVPYRGRWYYISDEDVKSKGYFVLLGTIFALQAGEIRTLPPLLTLPVNR